MDSPGAGMQGPDTTSRHARPPERRPIAARHWGSARALAGWLARHGVSPNAVSIAGMLCGLGAGAALAATALAPSYARVAWVGAAALILLRATANMLDGMVAVEFGRVSPVGELYNEVPDRVSDAVMLIGLGYASGGVPWLGYAAACAALLVAYVRAVGRAAGAPQEFGGPMAKQRRMFTVVAVGLYLGVAPRAWQPQWGAAPPIGLATVALAAISLGCLWTILWRLKRIASALQHPGP